MIVVHGRRPILSPDPNHAESGEPGVEVQAGRAGDPSFSGGQHSGRGAAWHTDFLQVLGWRQPGICTHS